MSRVLTTPVACKLSLQLLATTTGASLDVLSHEWFGTWHPRGGRSDAEFRGALIEAVGGRRATMPGPRPKYTTAKHGSATYVDLPQWAWEAWAEYHDSHGRTISNVVWCAPGDRPDTEGPWTRVPWMDPPSGVSRRTEDIPRDYIVAREQLERLLDAITPDEQVARCMDPVSTVAEVDAAIDVVDRLRVPAEPAPTTGLEGWGPQAVQGDGGVWTDIGGGVWAKWSQGVVASQEVVTSRAWAENGRVVKTEGDVTPADRVALEEAWAGDQRTRLVGSALKDDQPAVTKDQWVESKWRDCVSREGGSDRTEAQARCVASNAWVDRWHSA